MPKENDAIPRHVSNLRALEGTRRLGFTTLNACGMVKVDIISLYRELIT
jgi:hypothetical protein